jgi:hypothetical protein
MTAEAQGRAMSQALPERAESNQLGVRDDLRWVTKRATTPPAGLPIDNRPPKSSIELRRRGYPGNPS